MPDETNARVLLDDASAAIVEGVERCLASWVEQSVTTMLTLWGQASGDASERAKRSAAELGPMVAERVAGELRVLFGADPAQQHGTPLEIVRGAYREPTEILRAAGVAAIVRDEFAERQWPDDIYGLVPANLGDLGDPELAPLHLAWGLAKAKVMRARVLPPQGA